MQLDIALEVVTPTRATFRYRVAAPEASHITAIEGMTEHAFVIDGRARRLNRVAPEIFLQFERSR